MCNLNLENRENTLGCQNISNRRRDRRCLSARPQESETRPSSDTAWPHLTSASFMVLALLWGPGLWSGFPHRLRQPPVATFYLPLPISGRKGLRHPLGHSWFWQRRMRSELSQAGVGRGLHSHVTCSGNRANTPLAGWDRCWRGSPSGHLLPCKGSLEMCPSR